MPVNSIYQKLSSLIKVSDLPQQLSFVEDGLDQGVYRIFARTYGRNDIVYSNEFKIK